jgi:hypothetical protein
MALSTFARAGMFQGEFRRPSFCPCAAQVSADSPGAMEIFEILNQKHHPTLPSLPHEQPEDATWHGLHSQAMGALDTIREMAYLRPFHFFFKTPDANEIVIVFAQKERSGGYSVTAYLFDPLSAEAASLPPMYQMFGEVMGSRSAGQYVSLTLTSKKYLSDADLELRERLGIPHPGRKRFSWPRFREKRKGFAEGRLGRRGAEILRTALMLFERVAKKKPPTQLARNGPYFFVLDEGADPERPASWKLRTMQNASDQSMDLMFPEILEDGPESILNSKNLEIPADSGMWHVDLVATDTTVPCPGGMFYPILFVIMEIQEKEVDLLGAVLLSPADDIESCVAECFRETLDQAKNLPKTVVFSRKVAFPPLLDECASRGIETIETPSSLPYTNWFVDDIADMPGEVINKVFGIEPKEPRVATVRIELKNAHPRIYRDLRLPGGTTLVQLHYYIQDVFDWDDSHLYGFSISRGGDTAQFPKSGSGEDGLPSELAATLQSLYDDGIKKTTYIYDYGDDWTHEISIRSLKPPKEDEAVPALIGGQGAAPPEDCGGIYQYCHLRNQIESGSIKPDPEEYDDWMLRDIAEASFEFTEEEPLPIASNTSPPQNYEQSDGFFGF